MDDGNQALKPTSERIHKELNRIQKELKAPKNQYNAFGKYNYRNCEDILEGLKPILGECCVIMNDEVISIGDRFYIKSIVKLCLNDEEFLYSIGYAREPDTKKGMDPSQISGMASSYARKYAMNALFAIDDTKDADHFNNKDGNTQAKNVKSQPQPAAKRNDSTMDLLKKIRKAIDEADTIQKLNVTHEKVKNLSEKLVNEKTKAKIFTAIINKKKTITEEANNAQENKENKTN